MKELLLTLFLTAIAFSSVAQLDPVYAQYFNNPMLINPAFAGSNERLYAGIAYRSQWAGVDGGPVTYNFNSHIGLLDNRIGLGVMAIQDQLGDIRNTQFGTTYSYRIKLRKSVFSFGMQTGFTRYANDPNSVRVQNTPDPNFAQYTQTKFNTGAGFLLQSERFTVSFSVPRILPATVSQGGQKVQVYSQNFYLYGSYVFAIADRIQFKPSTLIRAVAGSPVSVDANANFIFNQLYTAGVFTRKLNTYGILLQMVMNNYRLAYVYEVPGKGSALNFDTHEVSLSISIDVLRSHNHLRNGFLN